MDVKLWFGPNNQTRSHLIELVLLHNMLQFSFGSLLDYRMSLNFNWHKLTGVKPASGLLHQGGIWVSRGGKNPIVCGGGGEGGFDGKRTICDRVQLLTLAKACNFFLRALFYRFCFRNRSRSASRGDHRKRGGTVTRLGGLGPWMPPPLGVGPVWKGQTIVWTNQSSHKGPYTPGRISCAIFTDV